jgi:hypothetical protein
LTRVRLRDAYSGAQLRGLYDKPYDCFERGADHIERVMVTAGLAAGALTRFNLESAADLSAGNGAVLNFASTMIRRPVQRHQSDLVPAPGLDDHGPVEETLERCPEVDLFICSETLEHLDDPDTVLYRISGKARYLIVSTPDGENNTINPEHYWGWDTEGIRGMLEANAFRPLSLLKFTPTPLYYTFQLWLAERTY